MAKPSKFFSATDLDHGEHAERDELIRLAYMAIESSSRLQDAQCDAALSELCSTALAAGDDSDIEAALSELKNDDTPAYDELLAMSEDCAQVYRDASGTHVLFLIPILAWSRYHIPQGKLSDAVLEQLAACYKSHYCADTARITIGDSLIAAEHIPERLSQVQDLLKHLVENGGKHDAVVSVAHLLKEATVPDFADSRYIALCVSSKNEADLFPSLSHGYFDRARAHMRFCLQAKRILELSLLGSVFDVQPPAAFFTAWRQGETAMRVYALKALVDFVACMGYGPFELIATTGIFQRAIESDSEPNTEIRIGIAPLNNPGTIIAGVVWPCMTEDVEGTQQFAGEVLASCDVTRIAALEQTFTMEWCEDCGAPLYANKDGLVTHIEVPEEVNTDSFAPTLN